jgi:hypothetical protein
MFYIYGWKEPVVIERALPHSKSQVASSRFNPAGSFENHNEGAELGIVYVQTRTVDKFWRENDPFAGGTTSFSPI